MIIGSSSRANIAIAITNCFFRSSHRSMLNCFCCSFSDIKKKADLFMCAATTIATLTNPKNLLNTIKPHQEDSQMAKTWLDLNQPFTLRQKVIHNVSQLKLNQPENKHEILKLFQIDHGLALTNLIVQQSIRDGAWNKQNDRGLFQQYFVFNPTSLFKVLYEHFIDPRPQRKILMGNYGIGKSSNQLLANILTTYIYQFRREGWDKNIHIEESILKNAALLKQVVDFSSFEIQYIEDEQSFVRMVKKKFLSIPLILYYSLPFFEKFQENYGVGFKQSDMLKYLTKQQIERLPNKSSLSFCRQMQRICVEINIYVALVIDQSNFYFSTIRKLQSHLQEKELSRKPTSDLQLHDLTMKAQNYGTFFNILGSTFSTRSNITLSCSETVEWKLSAVRFFKNSDHFFVTEDLLKKYSNYFFNKQFSVMDFVLNYGQNQEDQVWQQQMDFVFWFELESTILNSFYQKISLKDKVYQNSLLEALSYLKQYYYNLIMKGDLNGPCFWLPATRHMLIRQAFKRIQSEEIEKIKQIIETLRNRKKLQKIEYEQNSEYLRQFTKNIKAIRLKTNQFCSYGHAQAMHGFLLKIHTIKTKFFRMIFIMELYQEVKNLKKSQKYSVVLNDQQVTRIINNIQLNKSQIALTQIINQTFTRIQTQNYKTTLIFNLPLESLKKYLQQQLSNIDYEIVFTYLIARGLPAARDYAEKFYIQLLTTSSLKILVKKGNILEEFNIMNKASEKFISLASVMQTLRKKERMLMNVIQQESEQKALKKYGQKGKSFWSYFNSLPQSRRIKIIQSKDKIKSRKSQIKLPQQIVRDWQKTRPNQLNQTEAKIQKIWSHIFRLFNQENQIFQNLTFGARPINKNQTNVTSTESVNNPYFDMVLVKSQQKTNSKNYKIVCIDVTIGITPQNYERKIKNLILFKDYIFLNNLDFFNEIDFELWIICPKAVARPNCQKWISKFRNYEKQLDETNDKVSDPLTLKIISMDDLSIIGQERYPSQNRYNMFVKMLNIMVELSKKPSFVLNKPN